MIPTGLWKELRRRHLWFTLSILMVTAIVIAIAAILISRRVVKGQLAGERNTFHGLRTQQPEAVPGWVAANATAFLRVSIGDRESTSPDWRWNEALEQIRQGLSAPSSPKMEFVWFHGMYRLVYSESGPGWKMMCARRENPLWYVGLLGVVLLLAVSGGWVALRGGYRYLRQPVDRELEFYKALQAAKETFFAGIFHELGTPLTSLLARLELTLESLENGPIRDAVAKAYLDGQRIEQLSGDQLLRARLESGRIRLKMEAIDAGDLLACVVLRLEILCQHEKIATRVDVPEGLEVWGDRLRLEQALVNLVTNALKYAAGTDILVLSARKVGGEVCLEVMDQGPGFDPDQLPRLLKPFETQTPGQAKPGTGLGLFLVNEICKVHAGNLEFERVDAGFIARIRLPHLPKSFSQPK